MDSAKPLIPAVIIVALNFPGLEGFVPGSSFGSSLLAMNCSMQRAIEGSTLSKTPASSITETTIFDNISLSSTIPCDVLSLFTRVKIGIQGIAADISVAAASSIPLAASADTISLFIAGTTEVEYFSALRVCQTSAEPATCRRM